MIPVTTAKGKRIAVFGLGGSGIATARALVAGGADVTCWDDNPDSVEVQAGKPVIAVGDLHDIDWAATDSLVLAPGVPLTHPKPHWTVDLAKSAACRSYRRRRIVLPGAARDWRRSRRSSRSPGRTANRRRPR
jgi:UDP-N-acetylmuramoylalanine--D-glutamate ligase